MAAKGIIPKHHQKFIELVAKGITQTESYKISFGTKAISKKGWESNSSMLAKRYAPQIIEANERMKQAVIEAYRSEAVQIALREILTQAEVDAILSKKIKAKPIVLRDEKTGKGIAVDNTASDNLRAIDLYNKRFGSNAPVKQEISVSPDSIPLFNVPSNDSDSKAPEIKKS